MVIMKIKNIPTLSLETHKDADVFEDIFQTYIRMGTYQEKGMEIAITNKENYVGKKSSKRRYGRKS